MAEITAYSDDHWALSDDVTDDELMVSTRGDPTDVESSIETATEIVQGWWVDETGKDYPQELPDPTSLKDGFVNDRLASATEYMAASLEHEKRTENVRASESEEQETRKYVFLENRAHQLFDLWVIVRGYDQPGGPDGDGGDAGIGTPGVGEGKISALIDLANGGRE